MKEALCILLTVVMKISFAQSYSDIDWRVQSIDAPTPDSLAKLLTAPYTKEVHKARAIFSWIAQHISYNTAIFGGSARYASKYAAEPEDTSAIWKSADEMTAIKVLKKRTAVCDGYSKLFKTLCDYAGVRSEIITGYARGYMQGENKFRSNHNWNAVMIDSVWNLVDVTWASGHIDYANQFVERLDNTYFLTPPHQFIQDHYPDDLQWALMDNPPTIAEFKRMPFKSKSFVKYGIYSFSPFKGIMEAAIGDTVQIELVVKDPKRNKSISPDPFFDSTTIERSPSSVFLSASDTVENKFIYTYIVQSPFIEWLNVVYNKDVVMRYKLAIKRAVAVKLE
jgi:transglutaminase/protease-like cytokinesis protein 3